MEEKLYKFTFKTNRNKWYPDTFDIKLRKKRVGSISHGRVRFSVKKERTEKDPAPFKWVTLKRKFDFNDLAKAWVKENNDKIQKSLEQQKLVLHSFDC